MTRLLALLILLCTLLAPHQASAEPADIDAAARGVVRVVIIGTDGEEIFPVSHGTGFAVTPTMIVTNAHVVLQAQQDDTLRIGIVPSEGDDSSYASIVAVSPRNDLALVEIQGSLRLPPLTISGGGGSDSGEVYAVGYPMNVDRAQGLTFGDVFRSQPPVQARGFLSGSRPSRQFDTILHTAPIARGNSGGPLLDACGRVLGVNSFGTASDGGDGEVEFAVSTRELLPFLRENGVQPGVNALPCRSLADLDAAERERLEREQAEARQNMAARSEQAREKQARAQLEAEMAVTEKRENAMALALILLLVGVGAGVTAWQIRRSGGNEKHVMIASGIAPGCLAAALALWFPRPGLADNDRRAAAVMQPEDSGEEPGESAQVAGERDLLCTIDVSRSRITGPRNDDISFEWSANGCVNGRTQYGFSDGEWSRLFVPDSEAAVSVNSYDPQTRTFRIDRYLLSRSAMEQARAARGEYTPATCEVERSAAMLGEQQSEVIALLPEQPNERLVYECTSQQ